MIVYGSSRLIYGISQALQLGFGLTIGYNIVYFAQGIPESFQTGCRNPLPDYYSLLLLPVFSASLGILLGSNIDQLWGMILCTGVSFGVSYSLRSVEARQSVDSAPLIAAISVTVFARLFAQLRKQRPYVYILAGLMVLVPGAVGVKGMSNMWSGNVSTGMDFTFRMIMVGVSLSLGVFVALVPRKRWFTRVSSLYRRHTGLYVALRGSGTERTSSVGL